MNIRPSLLAALAVGLPLMLGGCAGSLEKPVIEDHSHAPLLIKRAKVAVFSTTAARREVLINYPKGGDHALICAEAPPDTADSVTSSLSLLATAQASNKASQAEIDATLNLTRDIANSVHQLYARTQGEQLFRDGAFHLCLALQNQTIDKDEYKAHFDRLLATAEGLISDELPLLVVSKAQVDAANASAAAAEARDAAIKAEAARQAIVKAAEVATKADGEAAGKKAAAEAAALQKPLAEAEAARAASAVSSASQAETDAQKELIAAVAEGAEAVKQLRVRRTNAKAERNRALAQIQP